MKSRHPHSRSAVGPDYSAAGAPGPTAAQDLCAVWEPHTFLDYAADIVDNLSRTQERTRADYHRIIGNHFVTFPALAEADVAEIRPVSVSVSGPRNNRRYGKTNL
jgi:hypothetical protein